MPSRSLAAALLVLAPLAARAGLVINMEEPGGPSTFSVEGKKMRIEGGAESKHTMIFDGAAQKLYQLDPTKKTYSEMTQADAQAVASQLKDMLAKLPPEQRARAEESLKLRNDKLADETKYEATGKHDKVAGFACDGYRVLRHGKAEEEGCFIPWGAGVVSKDDLAPLIEFGKFMDEFMSSAYGGGRRTHGIADELRRAPGFPASIQQVGEGKTEQRHRLTSLKRTSVPADQFAVPAGWTKVPNPMLGGGKHRGD